jgi:hypothetical protein
LFSSSVANHRRKDRDALQNYLKNIEGRGGWATPNESYKSLDQILLRKFTAVEPEMN